MRENDKYIRKYSEKELVQILQNLSYYSEEWEETDPEEEWLIVQSEVIEDNVIVKDAVEEKYHQFMYITDGDSVKVWHSKILLYHGNQQTILCIIRCYGI